MHDANPPTSSQLPMKMAILDRGMKHLERWCDRQSCRPIARPWLGIVTPPKEENHRYPRAHDVIPNNCPYRKQGSLCHLRAAQVLHPSMFVGTATVFAVYSDAPMPLSPGAAQARRPCRRPVCGAARSL